MLYMIKNLGTAINTDQLICLRIRKNEAGCSLCAIMRGSEAAGGNMFEIERSDNLEKLQRHMDTIVREINLSLSQRDLTGRMLTSADDSF